MWPVDVGNYRFSRASSYAATAAAAVEMGDGEMAAKLLGALEEDCPRTLAGGVAHRADASLWAHAVELMARCSRAGGLRAIVTASAPGAGAPFIADADYPQVLFARATATGGALEAVIYPGREPGPVTLTIGGLAPGRRYSGDGAAPVVADRSGEARIGIVLRGRIALRLAPSA